MAEKAHDGLEGTVPGAAPPAPPPPPSEWPKAKARPKARPKPGKSPAALAAEASSQAVKATAAADKTAATALDTAPQRQMIRVVGLKNHECKIIKERIKIVKDEETEVSKFVYDVLTNTELPGPIVKYVP